MGNCSEAIYQYKPTGIAQSRTHHNISVYLYFDRLNRRSLQLHTPCNVLIRVCDTLTASDTLALLHAPVCMCDLEHTCARDVIVATLDRVEDLW